MCLMKPVICTDSGSFGSCLPGLNKKQTNRTSGPCSRFPPKGQRRYWDLNLQGENSWWSTINKWAFSYYEWTAYRPIKSFTIICAYKNPFPILSESATACALAVKRLLETVTGDALEPPWVRRSNEEQYPEDVLLLKPLCAANGPQKTLSFTHLADCLPSPAHWRGIKGERPLTKLWRTLMCSEGGTLKESWDNSSFDHKPEICVIRCCEPLLIEGDNWVCDGNNAGGRAAQSPAFKYDEVQCWLCLGE